MLSSEYVDYPGKSGSNSSKGSSICSKFSIKFYLSKVISPIDKVLVSLSIDVYYDGAWAETSHSFISYSKMDKNEFLLSTFLAHNARTTTFARS